MALDSFLHQGRVQLGCTVLAVVVYAVVLFFNYAGAQPDLGIFSQSVGNVSDKYEVYITPPGYIFTIWAVIYFWLLLGLAYALSQLCRRAESGGPVYLTPVTLPTLFWLVYITNQVLNVGWLFIWDQELLTGSAVMLAMVMLTNWLSFAILHRRLYLAVTSLEPPCRREVWALRIIFHNGLAVYVAWTSIAFLIALDVALVYGAEASNSVVSSVLLGVLAAGIVLWLVLELTVLDKYTRYTVTPGFVFVWALAGVFDKSYHTAPDATPALMAVALAVASAALAVRLVTLAVFAWRDRSAGGLAVSEDDSKRSFHLR